MPAIDLAEDQLYPSHQILLQCLENDRVQALGQMSLPSNLPSSTWQRLRRTFLRAKQSEASSLKLLGVLWYVIVITAGSFLGKAFEVMVILAFPWSPLGHRMEMGIEGWVQESPPQNLCCDV